MIVSLVVLFQGAILSAEPEEKKPDLEAALEMLRQQVEPFDSEDEVKRLVGKLVDGMGDDDFLEREKAARELSAMSPEIAPFLRAASKRKSREIVARTKTVLRRLEKKRVQSIEQVGDAIDDLLVAGDKRVIPLLLDLMESNEAVLRYYADAGMMRATGKSFDFEAYGDARGRTLDLLEWRDWWRSEKGQFEFVEASKQRVRQGILIANDVSKEIVLLDVKGKVLWRRGLEVSPIAAALLPNGHYLVAHGGGACEYDRRHKKVWDNSKSGLGANMIYDIQRLRNGNTLLCYVSDGHVTELSPAGKVVWQMKDLSSPGAAERLENGNTLICENHGNRIIEVTRDKKIVWEHGELKNPASISRLKNGNVLVGEWGANRAFEVTRAKKIVWQHGHDKEVSSASRLPEGNTIVAKAGTISLVDKDGKVIREIYGCDRKYGKVGLVKIPSLLPRP